MKKWIVFANTSLCMQLPLKAIKILHSARFNKQICLMFVVRCKKAVTCLSAKRLFSVVFFQLLGISVRKKPNMQHKFICRTKQLQKAWPVNTMTVIAPLRKQYQVVLVFCRMTLAESTERIPVLYPVESF